MKGSGLPKKFLSRRGKNGHERTRSGEKHRPLSSDAFFSFFRSDSSKEAAGEKSEPVSPERTAAKIEEVRRKLAETDFPALNDDQIRYALNLKYSGQDVDKAIEILTLQRQSLDGKITPYDPAVNMLGAENRGNVTCYLDSLLFAMFAKLESFECMLEGDKGNEEQKNLAALLRLWVNMLRSGKLIEMDMTHHIQDALAACGWPEALHLEQQDTSEAFAFITETLQLPLLPLKVDLFHHGKKDDADHKVVYERLLNLAVPPDTDGKGVKLEDCLEEYFNSEVSVLREGSSDDQKSLGRSNSTPAPASTPAPVPMINIPETPETPKSTIRVVTEADQQEGSSPGSTDEESSTPSSEPPSTPPEPVASAASHVDSSQSASGSAMRPQRSRTESIIQRVVLDENEKPVDAENGGKLFNRSKRSISVVKAITIPAWQFFRLIPWHLPAKKNPESDLEVAGHFKQRPVVGICLKRYMVDENGNTKRQNTFIDIPDSLRLPHFILDDRRVEENGLSADYKLVLQSVVCHRGDTLHAGHYISFCRVAPKLLTDNRRHDNDPPPDYEEAQWVKFDDLAWPRVTPVDDIKQSLKEEMPYLLFYQIVPIVDVAASTTGSIDAEPPAYDHSGLRITTSEAWGPNGDRDPISRQASSYFDNNSSVPPSTNNSVRFSTELERPPRHSFADEDGFLSVSRRGSVAHADSGAPSIGTASEGPSPAVTPSDENASTALRLSRAAAKFRSSKSRPQSQAGEGRLSLTMSRLGLVRSSREPLRDPAATDSEENAEAPETNGAGGAAETKEKEREKEKEKEKGKEKEKEREKESQHKRGKSKTRTDKSKSKEGKSKAEVPDRECIVQ
ncbi:ubiquitin carboxyl-terminal hydrolase-domain-containing protein [Xylariomycetidae sp. FL0641]|nr:ubiquitin carboxyl-terminal hydrolase-domain-containing protein [Xylariomycetidae sp. FL0641]